jgi:hypothetical protein
MRRFSACALCALALAGCGDDEEGSPARTETDRPAETREAAPAVTTPPTAAPEPADTEAPATPEKGATTSPEDSPGGAGDEVPASSQALLTGRGGEITPRVVLVPPYIAVKVELRSGDGARYTLSGHGRELAAEPGSAASVTLEGLRPGDRYVLRSGSGRVVIEASAEPGP